MSFYLTTSFTQRLCCIIFLLTFAYLPISAQQGAQTENVFLITLDGLRWQELFSGADPLLITHEKYVSDTAELKALFWKESSEERKDVLMPFFHQVIAQEGQLYGNREENSLANLTNTFWFSYPGYNEILSGFGDERIDSNAKKPNPNRTILEYANAEKDFKNKVATFASWDVFPYIINEERSGVPVNAGYENASGKSLSVMEKALNTLQPIVPGHWSTVRMDAFTHYYALEHLKKHKPRLLYIAYGETDDFAHDGKYDEYLKAAHRTDQFIKDLWEYVQSDKQYRDKTTFIITTDHGRGTQPIDTWRSHGEDIKGADQVWYAIIGPDTPAMNGKAVEGQFYSNQVAPTVAAFLKLNYQPEKPSGKPIYKAFQPTNTKVGE
ncbi:sulfatase-like hydrolase/transferase [Porifericola rhodea]|uniref:alkaline phosphatase family protein n=1 Tax=Porifericola rhodea TaxID=930972 RepID=UPI002665BA92|nr:alkaline phosphatase family protein [Porifericola rhodea]WKN30927.1 sulfatase-like hydrolase/transferase [Porifericola rhodea]